MKPFDMIVKFKFKTEIVGKKPLYCTNITFSSGCRSIETLVFHASQKEQERWFLPSFEISDRLEVGAELRTLLKTPYSRDGFDYVFSIGNVTDVSVRPRHHEEMGGGVMFKQAGSTEHPDDDFFFLFMEGEFFDYIELKTRMEVFLDKLKRDQKAGEELVHIFKEEGEDLYNSERHFIA